MSNLVIAIHHNIGSFSDQWLEYCKVNSISVKKVDCFSADIISQLCGCSGLMWNWAHYDHKAQLFARQLAKALEHIGFPVFPNFSTCWHYDDKLAQKYLLESVDAPLIPSYVFYDEEEALKWAKKTGFPKVWKLRCGAGSENVRLVKNFEQAVAYIKRSFGTGWSGWSRFYPLQERLFKFKHTKDIVSFFEISKGLGRILIPRSSCLLSPVEKNYVYFQDFIPGNDHDIRIVVVGNRAFGIKRIVREGDFRASGSGRLVYDPTQIPTECVRLAFDVTRRINSQCVGYDIIFDHYGPRIIEITYSFSHDAYRLCPGYWDADLVWHNGRFICELFMIEDFMKKCLYSKNHQQR